MISDFPQIMKILRQSRNIIRAKLAKAQGDGSTAIANYELGRNEPDFDILLKIADFFDVPAGSFIGERK